MTVWDEGRGYGREAYHSVYLFGGEYVDYVTRRGSVRGYDGPCKAEGLLFDLDGDGALQDARRLIEAVCCDRCGVTVDDIRVWFSGRRGFHVLVRSVEIDGLPPSRSLPGTMRKLADVLAGGLGSYDPAVYDRARLIRRGNSRHPASGLYKVPLLVDEVFSLYAGGIHELARAPRALGVAASECIARLTTGECARGAA
jgi:hypothetical protein